VETGRGRVDRDEARARLERHGAEMRLELPRIEARARAEGDTRGGYEARDLNRTDGTGGYAVPPAWLMGEYINMVRAHRITADLCTKFQLPAGTDSINIPKLSTGTAVAIQTADNATIQETDLADTSVQANVKTIAGQQDLAMQLIDQSPINFDQIVFQDLIADYAQKLDVQVISGSNASGQVKGIRSIASVTTVTYTDASPTVPELYPKIASAINTVNTARYMQPEVLIMHPRRWLWMLASLDSSNRPLVVPAAQGPNNGMATQGGIAPEGTVGYILGVPVVCDPNIPTTVGGGTEDIIIAAKPSDYYLWEGPIRSRVLNEVLSANLTVRLQVFGYLAFMPDRRPESTCLVSGTGLASPSF
jgi:HK97 family phage major capsid protein